MLMGVITAGTCTGFWKKVGARLREKFSLATVSPGRPCQAGAHDFGQYFLLKGGQCRSVEWSQLELGPNPKKRFESIPCPYTRDPNLDSNTMRLRDFFVGWVISSFLNMNLFRPIRSHQEG